MPAHVVHDHAIAVRKRVNLRLPHAVVHRHAVGEDDNGAGVGPHDPIGEINAIVCAKMLQLSPSTVNDPRSC